MTKLNLGCGQNKKEGYVNVDKFDSCQPDLVLDLETFPWPFENNSVEEIVMHHVLEHLGATVPVFFSIMKELYRICAPGAKIFVAVPHPRSDGFAGDPTHVRPVNLAVMSLFSKKNNLEWKRLGWPNSPLAMYLDVDFEVSDVVSVLTPHWSKQVRDGTLTREGVDYAVNTYFNVVDEIKFTLTVCK